MATGDDTRVALDTAPLALGKTPALIVVDASCGFTDPQCPLGSAVDDEIAVINTLIERARSGGWPCCFSTVVYDDAAQASVFRRKVPALNLLTRESGLGAIDPRLSTRGGDLILEKTHASCFHETELDEWLRARDVDSLLITGFTTSGCVRATAVDALQYNYPTFVVTDAVADRDPQAHAANLYDLQAKYTELIDSRTLLER
ncbi:MAG: isochorismatase family protein [Pseudomonadota bacterium]